MIIKNGSIKAISTYIKVLSLKAIIEYASVLSVMVLPVVGGCTLDAPKVRLGCLPTSTFGVPFANPDDLGKHSYSFSFFEKGGIVYTCKAGNIDIDHVRGSADLTRYFIKRVRKNLLKKGKGFSYNLAMELSTHKINFIYPKNWKTLPPDEKEKIANEIAFELGPYLAYNATLWHEILTWFGVHFVGFEPEFNSAFSWEDVYSNLLGTKLAVQVLRETNQKYNTAMTLAIYKELRKLDVQPKSTAIEASEKMRGKWFTGDLIPDIKMRNFDIGLDGYVTPTLIPEVHKCKEQPLPCPVPNLNILKDYEFSIIYEIKPNVFEQGRIFNAAGEKKIYPEKHFPVLLEHIKKEASQKGYLYEQ